MFQFILAAGPTAAHRVHADALEIEAQAKHRLADEYDAAQASGELPKNGGDRKSKIRIPMRNSDPSTTDSGVSAKEIHDARLIRDAEVADPGVVRRVIDTSIAAGDASPLARALIGAMVMTTTMIARTTGARYAAGAQSGRD